MPDGATLIDVHAHFLTADYVDAAVAGGHAHPDGMPGWPSWSVDEHLRIMDKHGIDKAMLSISSPGVHFGDDAAAVRLAREVNDYAAQVSAAHPDRFGFFGAVPLPDVDGAIAEAGRAIDELGAAGVVVETNSQGTYVGDAAFEPFLQALNERHTALFIHPTSPPAPDKVSLGMPRPMMEFLVETTRNLTSLLMNDSLDRNPDVQVIATHCGGFISLLIDRLELFDRAFGSGDGDPARLRKALGRVWFDIAGTPAPTVGPTLAGVVGRDRLLFGTDYCWTPAAVVDAQLALLEANWPAAELGEWREITSAAAARLFAGN